MGKRKGPKENQETLISKTENGEREIEEDEEKGGRFFACYLLTSLCPRFKGHTYIGFTVNPRRRIRQHNGEIGSGAWRTKKKRPWEMALCIYGFPTNVAALQFEWAWQHPVESLAVRTAAASFKSLSGIANKIKLAYTMLTLPSWQSLNLTINFFSTKYQKYTSGSPTLPQQIRTQVGPMDDLPCYDENAFVNDDEECDISDNLQESAKEASIEAIRETHNFPSSHHEVNFHKEINRKDNADVKSSEVLPKNSSPIREENRDWSLFTDDSPTRKLSSFCGSSFVVEDVQSSRLDESIFTEFDYTLEKQSTSALVGDEDEVVLIKSPDVLSHEIEIIDLFTPSPCYTMKIGSKKRRATMYPEIIDLTNSPMFV
ncbi:hypothetical protein ACJIZ3_017834 [Penstemon smallii]|uniref:Structure-specific endonuclease subunit SLX1 homolog n=1 Tax=Penstemon smallii TaxID=265156 RepID=A0ABD3SWQ3_9LAMI